MVTDDLYKQTLLDHFRHPRNRGRIEAPDASAEAVNPLCGDQLELTLAISAGCIRELKFRGRGCAISQASASMMTEVMVGQELSKAQELAANLKALLRDESPRPLPQELQPVQVLEGVKQYRSRITCALLAWEALADAIAAV